jgi:hypothetical protein
MQHSGDFSNLRTEITLNNGTRFIGYTTYESGAGNIMQIYNPANKVTTNISLQEINKLEIEEVAFLVKWIETPVQVRKKGMPAKKMAVLRRLANENPDLQVFEYKYSVKHPKSPLNKTETAIYVQFGHEDLKPLKQMGTPAFDQQWKESFMRPHHSTESLVVASKSPKSLKSLLKLAQSNSAPINDGAAATAE